MGKSLSNKIGRLAHWIRDVAGNGAIEFAHKSTIPKDKKVAYASMVCDHIPLKSETHRVCLTLGGYV